MKVIPYFGASPNERKLLRRLWTNTDTLGKTVTKAQFLMHI